LNWAKFDHIQALCYTSLNFFYPMPTRHSISRKSANADFAIRRKEAEFRRRKQKAVRMAKLEKAAATK
jgi:hypothetical protein